MQMVVCARLCVLPGPRVLTCLLTGLMGACVGALPIRASGGAPFGIGNGGGIMRHPSVSAIAVSVIALVAATQATGQADPPADKVGAGKTGVAQDAHCAAEPIAVRGEAATYTWIAKLKARANWRARVRSTTGLGDAFANWKNAIDIEERCISDADGTICTLHGTPCSR